MANTMETARRPDPRPPPPAPPSGVPFANVLRHELTVLAARRDALGAERGDLAATGPPAEDEPLDSAWRARLLGLSFSGGGIRSATFNLGVLQALARSGLLRYVDYLSTVSGGGYIGSWLTALCQRRFARTPADTAAGRIGSDTLLGFNRNGFAEFEKKLAWSAGDGDERARDREDRAIRFLREFSNYLTPKLGLFSGDTWALIAIYVRNALLNQLVLFSALICALLAPRLLSPLLGAVEATSTGAFLIWIGAVLVVHLFVCFKLGKNLSGITRSAKAEPSPLVIKGIGVPLTAICISATSWLGQLDDWLRSLPTVPALADSVWRPWVAAAVVGAVVSLFTWTCACASARWSHGRPWGPIERKFWSQMVAYSLFSGPLFGVVLHAASSWLFTDEIYAGFGLVAALPSLALAVLVAGVLHIGLAAKNVSGQYTEWISRFGGLMLIGSFSWIAFNGLVFLAPLLVAWFQGLGQTLLSSGWLLTTLASVVFGRNVASSSRVLPRLFMQVAPWVFIIGLVVALAAGSQAALHLGTVAYGNRAQATVAERQRGAEADSAKAVIDARFRTTQSSDVFGRVEVGESSVEIRGRLVEETEGEISAAIAVQVSPFKKLVSDYGRWLNLTDHWLVVAIAMVVTFLLTLALSRRIDINVFSLHGMYANRLVRCYLGASVPERNANPFSGLSSRDDLQLHAAPRAIGNYNMLVHPVTDGAPIGVEPFADQASIYPGPYHLINTAINLVAGGNLAYQERKAGSFLLSPLYCGFQLASSSSEGAQGEEIDVYRPTTEFSSRPRPLTLGESVATSGAAASPNMGYHSTPAFAFLMGVFNIRLGRWVGNPFTNGNEKSKTWFESGPKVALWHLLREVFGLTDNKSRYVYLSDGGHFENLGIYELVRRRCRYIIACDAGADERYGFEDLANAIRKCRTDLGVEIDLDVRQIADVDANRYNGAPCAVGTVHYSANEVGLILYIKASRRQGLPADVMHYASEHPAFPHESTADQFFSESQFESYRRLGHFLAGEILDTSRATTVSGVNVDELFRELGGRWYRPSRAIASNFARLADEVDELFERLRTAKELEFLSKQFYPEWRSLLREPFDPDQQMEDLTKVPKDEEQLRQGFYFCNSLIQLMETAYIDLNLETEWQHPDNSGWLNVFNHWAWSGMFRMTWAVAAATYGGRFRSFCERRLNLELGDVYVEPVVPGKTGARDLAGSGLNRHEQRQVEALRVIDDDMPAGAEGRPALEDADTVVYRLDLHVRHPIGGPDSALMQFGFGYAALRGNDLIMYRVQDHLRGMGLGRKGLVALVEQRRAKLGLKELIFRRIREFLVRFHEQADPGKFADFRAMVVSVNEEWEERNR